MRDHRDRWKWPVSLGLTLVLLWAAVFLLPRSWLDFLLAPQARLSELSLTKSQEPLLVLPPLVIEMEPPPSISDPKTVKIPPEPPTDPRWWTEGWAVKTTSDEALFAESATAVLDTVVLVLQALGVGADLLTRARPDSVLAARLFMLQVEDNFRYEELKPYLTQMARSRAYAAILARAADMYGEHLSQEIQVPK